MAASESAPAREPHYTGDSVTVWAGECLDVLAALPDASVDAVVTDPPYGLAEHKPAIVAKAFTAWLSGDRDHVPDGRGFMGRDWDRFVPPPAVFDECLRVLKPGGWLLCFAGSRTVDLMTTSVRFAGFEIRDSIAWLHSQGFPKSLDVSKAIDKAAGAEREVVGRKTLPNGEPRRKEGPSTRADGSGWARPWQDNPDAIEARTQITAPATEAAERWQGWGTALKPAFEPIVVARKPLGGNTVAGNVLEHGTGALNIDGCRVDLHGGYKSKPNGRPSLTGLGDNYDPATANKPDTAGRWPTNVVLDDTQAAELDTQTGILTSGAHKASHRRTTPGGNGLTHGAMTGVTGPENETNAGGASRFFPVFKYQAKAPAKERPKDADGKGHPTVKPLELMRWLVRLVTPPGGVVLDPFAGSGTTVEASLLEGFRCVAVEREPDYLPLIVQRIERQTVAPAPSETGCQGEATLFDLDETA